MSALVCPEGKRTSNSKLTGSPKLQPRLRSSSQQTDAAAMRVRRLADTSTTAETMVCRVKHSYKPKFDQFVDQTKQNETTKFEENALYVEAWTQKPGSNTVLALTH